MEHIGEIDDESRKRFEVLAREVFTKFKACLTMKAVNDFRTEVSAINYVYKSLQDDRETADISGIMRELHDVIDQAIVPRSDGKTTPGKQFDISAIDFDRLRAEFERRPTKRTDTLNLMDAVEKRLARMLAENPTRTNFQSHYEEIVAAYNGEKDRVTIEATFENLTRHFTVDATRIEHQHLVLILFRLPFIKEPAPEKWKDAEHPHPTLSAVSVFDSDCASVHIKEKNKVAFRPFGIDVPDELANACQAVRDSFTNEQKRLEKARNPLFLRPSWKETTAVGKALAALKHDTDVTKIEALAKLTEEENARLARLKEDLSKDPSKAAAEQTLKADNVKRLLDAANLVEGKTTDKALAGVASAAADAAAKREAARLAASKAFSGEPLKGVGSEVWRVLWDAARRYSTEIAYSGQAFPPSQADARCVLCQQPLDAEARDRMARFEEFIQKDTERQAQEAEIARESARHALVAVVIGTRQLKANLQEVALQNADLARRTRRFMASCRLRRYSLLKGVDAGKPVALLQVATNPAIDLTQLEKGVRDYAAELKKSATAEERKKLELELAELGDRAMLGGMTQIVCDEVERLKTIHFLGECLGDTTTNTITKVGNDIADTVITPKLRDRFQEEIVKLAADKVRVEIVRSGGKYGSPQYQVRLFAKPDAKVQDILSEGEKTCVALAAFLTELATAVHKSALVFDDPVSSLDHRWRKQVATRLVEEAGQRQIIVFTHDLVFVNDLCDLGHEKKRAIRPFTVSRGQPGAGLVAEGMPWKAQRVEERIDNLEKDARSAKQLYDNNQQDEYNREAAGVYNGLRASWERALEDVAFFRMVQRHRDYIDTTYLKKASVLTGADCDTFHAAFKKCCNVVDAHDPSSGRNADTPPPNEVMQDIQTLKDWVAGLRDRQKNIA